MERRAPGFQSRVFPGLHAFHPKWERPFPRGAKILFAFPSKPPFRETLRKPHPRQARRPSPKQGRPRRNSFKIEETSPIRGSRPEFQGTLNRSYAFAANFKSFQTDPIYKEGSREKGGFKDRIFSMSFRLSL